MSPDAYLVVFLFLVGFQIVTFLSVYLSIATLSGRLRLFALYLLVSVSSFAGFSLFYFQYHFLGYALLLISGASMLKSALVFRWEVCA